MSFGKRGVLPGLPVPHFLRQILRSHILRGGHDRNPAADVFQLTHVSREGVAGQRFHRVRLKPLYFNPKLLRGPDQKVVSKKRDILGSLFKRWEPDPDHIKPVEQILTELPLRHTALEILVRRCDDPHIGVQRLMAAHPIEISV